MVMRRSDIKRIPKDVSDSLEDNPKRTKVHAQRKFAQGSGMNSPVMTPIKDKEKTKVNGASSSPELLPSKRPRTEDFLTFLCFRGTEALPSRLDFFNSASNSTKNKDGSTPGTSKQQQDNKMKRVKPKLKNAKVVHSLKNKLHDKRLGTRSTRLAQKANSALHTRQRQLEDRQKKLTNVVTKKQLVRGRPAHHPSILKRLGAARLRTGLRSGGQLPPGSDIGIKSDRKPRKKLLRAKVTKTKKVAITRAGASKRKTENSRRNRNESENEEDDDNVDDDNDETEDEDEADDEDNKSDKKTDDSLEEKDEKNKEIVGDESDSKDVAQDDPLPKKSCRISTRSRASSGSPANPPNSLNISSRPSRKTKEAATLYMEMLTKDMRSPEEEEDDVFGKGNTQTTSFKRSDESSVSVLNNTTKTKQIKSREQANKQREIKGNESPIMTRASRRGRFKSKINSNLNREDVRVTRGQSGIHSRGRPTQSRRRGRPPLTRIPAGRRVLRTIRKVTNFAEDETESEDEEDEMFVESILSEEMEQLEMGPGRSKPARSSTSITRSSRGNFKVDSDESQDEQEVQDQIEDKKVTRRKTRSCLNSSRQKSLDGSSEEDTKRQTRNSKDKEDIAKEKKRSLPKRRSRQDNSESDAEKSTSTQKEIPPPKRGRKDSIDKVKENVEKEKQISSNSKVECTNAGKKNFLEDKKEVEESSPRVMRNQSDQSVAYLLLSLAQMKGWQESETDCQSNEENSATTRSTRGSLKESPKEEIKAKRGRRRNTSVDSGLVEKMDEDKPGTPKKNKREITAETSTKGKTRSSKSLGKDESGLQSDEEIVSSSNLGTNRPEDLRKLSKKETISNKSDSDDGKFVNKRNVKSGIDMPSKRTGRYKASIKENDNTSESETEGGTNTEEIKEEVKRGRKGRKKSSTPRKIENSDVNLNESDKLMEVKNLKLKSEHLELFDMKSDTNESNKGALFETSQKVKDGDNNQNGSFKVKQENLNSEIENIIKKENEIDLVPLTIEGKRNPVTVRKSSADSNASRSSIVRCQVLLQPINVNVNEPLISKVNDEANSKCNKKSIDSIKTNVSDDGSNSAIVQKEVCKDKRVINEANTKEGLKLSKPDQSGRAASNNSGSDSKMNITEKCIKNESKHSKHDTSSSDESERELSKAGKEIFENRSGFGSRKRFPRRSRMDYYSHNSNRDPPKRVAHSRKVKSMNERYIEEDSYSSDFSTSSEEPRISTLKSQKRIKPKNSTQNDAIESAMREAQNAKLKQETKDVEIICHKSRIDTVKNLFNLSTTPNEGSSKREGYDSVRQIADKNNAQLIANKQEETKSYDAHEAERSNEKAIMARQITVEKIEENKSLIAQAPLNSQNKSFDYILQNNTSLSKTNVFNTGNDNSGVKHVNVDGESKKQSMSETWRQAFKNAKIPKPGQSSPVPHGVKPFVRKPFTNPTLGIKQTEVMKITNPTLSKISNPVNQFKSSAFQAMGKYSPNRVFPNEESIKSQSPSRRPIEIRDSPSKSSVSSSDDSRALSSDNKKLNEQPVKSLTQLQYEKRSSDLISSLKDAPIIIDPSCPVAPFTSKLKEAAIEATPQRTIKPSTSANVATHVKSAPEGKHLNLPLAVEHTLRKMSPITVSKKPLIVKNAAQNEKKVSQNPFSDKQKEISDEVKDDSVKSESQVEETTAAPRTTNIEMLGKKKVNMTTEEIKRWLDDSTSSGIEHAKDCGIFEKNQCECSYRTSGPSMLVGRGVTLGESSTSGLPDNRLCQQSISNTGAEIKVDRGFVEPPVQLRELAEIASKYGGEIISTCKVEDYRERVLSKNKDASQKRRQSAGFKSDRSMTEEEMCDFDFRFDRISNSPRESGSEMSSPPPLRDDISEKSDLQHPLPSERKPIFQQRRSCGVPLKRPPQSKSPAAAFSAENESSVYAFEPEEPPVSALDKPFRRRSSKGNRDDEAPSLPVQQPPSSSIAVQVNLESEAVLETEAVLECCTTQTDQSQDEEENGSGGRSFYIPIEQSSSQLTPQQTIKGVTLKVESEGPNNQRVMLRAKLVTKPPSSFATPSTSHRSLIEGNADNGGNSISSRRKPEQKVRPLAARAPPPVGTVQPTLREEPEQAVVKSPTKSDKPRQASQGTQSSPRPSSATSLTTNLTEAFESVEILKPKGLAKVGGNNPPSSEEEVKNFPQHSVSGSASMLEAPTFYPTEKEFGDPLEYIEKITPLAQHHGICRIVPPPTFKPECKVSDDMRFAAYNQYIHQMLHRWGPNVREMSAIRKYLATQNIALNQPPLIGGMEVDLPRLYQTVQQCGGLKEVYEKKRWTKVADVMKIPKSAQDRVTKLDDIYCKFLLPYDTLSHEERSQLLDEVEVEWKEREKRILEEDEDAEKEETSDNESDTDERDECITKGKSVALSGFYRIARNTMSTWFSKDSTPGPIEVENEFWRHVTTGMAHVCVHSGSIDTATWGCGFPTGKERSTAKHPWNLKILTNNPRSILRSLGPVIGVTVPTLHVGMLFSACCWYRDPHALPWIEYLHTGANKIWYGVPDCWSEELKIAVKRLMPRYCRDKKKIWLASDTVMVPPQLLVKHNVSVCRTVQEPGQFVVVFPRAFTSSLCTGYLVSESVYFAHSSWLDTSRSVFKDIQDSCEPPIFSLEKLLFNIATDIRSSAEVLTQILPMVIELKDEELSRRRVLEGFGLVADEKLPVTKGRRTKSQEEPNEYECEICRGNLFLSLVTNTQEEINYCLVHAIEIITKEKDVLKNCKLMYAYDEEEMDELIEKIKNKIETKNQKKHGKNANTSSSTKS